MRLVVLLVLILGIGGLAGLVALDHRQEPRYGLIGDPVVGYRVSPSMSGDGFSTNALSMRSSPPPPADDGCTLRVMIFGDSVVFGGDLGDDELATSRLERVLEERLDWPVWVGNAAAGGWSPNNIRGFVERFGWLQADMTAFVLNSHDIDQSLAIDPHDRGRNAAPDLSPQPCRPDEKLADHLSAVQLAETGRARSLHARRGCP